jgi:tetratricopeptide (TPR) repeat protein
MNRTKLFFLFYISLILVFLYVKFLSMPIFAGDTDIWYHLSSGRYISEKGEIPKESYFSFISPAREWTDYYWLFQLIVYKVYLLGQYYGLVMLRFLLFFLATLISLLILFEGRKESADYPLLTIFFVLFLALLTQRYMLLRPHAFSYLFLLFMVYVLEVKKRYAKYLFLLGIAWSNIHGIEYPVMVFLLISYILDVIYERKKEGTSLEKADIRYILPLLFTCTTPFLTPHFFDLMVMPFVPISFAKHYIRELSEFSFSDFASVRIDNFLISYETLILLLFLLALLFLLNGLLKKTLKLRHLLLFLAGLALLSMGKRFAYECFILTLPLVRVSFIRVDFHRLKDEPLKIFIFSFILVSLFLPSLHLKKSLESFPRYPFSFKGLPHGVAIFLNKVNAQGSVLNHPNPGGYLQWLLYPKYRIFMDMEVPFLFTNEDMFVATRIFNFFDHELLKAVIKKYDPSFVIGPISSFGFKRMMERFPDYRMVFFDDSSVLYANIKHYPILVQEFELKKIDPYDMRSIPLESEETKREFERIIRFHPECAIANEYLSRLYLRKNDFESALNYAENIIKAYPESHLGYKIKADILTSMKSYKRAIYYYKKALQFNETPDTLFSLGKVYFEMGEFDHAYKLMVKAINLFSPGINHRDLYYVIKSAILSKKIKEASILFKYGMMMVPKDDKEYIEKYKELLRDLSEYFQGNMQLYGFPAH